MTEVHRSLSYFIISDCLYVGIPTIICINKIDAPGVTDETLRAIEKQVQEYIALEKAPMVQISAKGMYTTAI